MNSTLAQSVFATLAYFDIFHYPLTKEELFQHLWRAGKPLSYKDFIFELPELFQNELHGKIETEGGYYFLAGKKENIGKREQKVFFTEQKIKIARRAARKLRYIPFVRALFICNLLPVVVKPSSDIDVFIIAKENRIWMVRFLSSIVLTLFGLRPTNFGLSFFSPHAYKSMTDKICLSFYVTEEHLDLSNICIEGVDIYQLYWNTHLIPLYDPQDFYTQFRHKNTWVKQYLNFSVDPYKMLPHRQVRQNFCSQKFQYFLEWVLSSSLGLFFERWVKAFQLKKIHEKNERGSATLVKSIVVSDTMLKFHENDRKKYFQEEWLKKMNESSL